MEITQQENTIYHIFNWSDKKISAMSLASINLAFLIHFISNMNFFSLASYLLLFYLIVGITLYKIISTKEIQIGDSYEYITKDEIESFLKNFYHLLLNLHQYHLNVCSLNDKVQTLMFILFILSFYYLSVCLSEVLITCLTLNVLFLWSPIYNSNKQKIDSFLDMINSLIHNIYCLIKSKIPKYEDIKEKTE